MDGYLRAVYNLPNQRAKYCGDCKSDGMVNPYYEKKKKRLAETGGRKVIQKKRKKRLAENGGRKVIQNKRKKRLAENGGRKVIQKKRKKRKIFWF